MCRYMRDETQCARKCVFGLCERSSKERCLSRKLKRALERVSSEPLQVITRCSVGWLLGWRLLPSSVRRPKGLQLPGR